MQRTPALSGSCPTNFGLVHCQHQLLRENRLRVYPLVSSLATLPLSIHPTTKDPAINILWEMAPVTVIRETGCEKPGRYAEAPPRLGVVQLDLMEKQRPGVQRCSSLTTLKDDCPAGNASFEWINVQEKDTTARIKSHVRRELQRRQKAKGLRFQQLREGSGKKLISAPSPVSPATKDGEELVEDKLQLPKVAIAASASASPPPLTILDGGRFEPFDVLPVKLNSHKDLGFIHHCMSDRPRGCPASAR